MVDILIKMDTPELDKLLLRFQRGDLTDADWVKLHDMVEHEHVEASRREEDQSGRKVSMAILLATIEARREREIIERTRNTWWKRLKVFFLTGPSSK